MQEDSLKKAGVETRAPDAIRVASLSLENFRNYEHLHLELHEGFNVFAGANGQGKTNLLEALYLLATTRLLRGQKDVEAIRHGGPERAVVAAELGPAGTRIGFAIEKGVRKRALLNGVALPRASDLIGRLPCVSVSTTDMEIVRGEPAERRLFLDLELSAMFPSYLRHLTHYKRALDQRNALIRSAREFPPVPGVFEPWEAHIADHGVAMRQMREDFVHRLRPRMARIHAQMGQGEPVAINYAPKDPSGDSEALRQLLEETRHLDIARGTTQAGPHRDDLQIEVLDREARLYGSQGQQRTAVIALKLATLEVMRQELGIAPLLLLDDIFSDLDERRRALLVEVVLENAGQVALTCTEPAAAGPSILKSAHLFHVAAGEVSNAT